jgi:hypothetical protein
MAGLNRRFPFFLEESKVAAWVLRGVLGVLELVEEDELVDRVPQEVWMVPVWTAEVQRLVSGLLVFPGPEQRMVVEDPAVREMVPYQALVPVLGPVGEMPEAVGRVCPVCLETLMVAST